MNDLVFAFLNYLSIGISFVFLILAFISSIILKKIENEDFKTSNPLLRLKKYYTVERNIYLNCICLESIHFFILLTLSIFGSPIYVLRFGTWLILFIISILGYNFSSDSLKELEASENDNLEE